MPRLPTLLLSLALVGPVWADDKLDDARAALDQQLQSLSGMVSVVSSDCDGKPCLVVNVDEETDAIKAKVPSQYQGYAVRIQGGAIAGY